MIDYARVNAVLAKERRKSMETMKELCSINKRK